ncbi:helix-turn-helix domain-containing protein [Flavihumibacter cheonanensis]|uniref:helix-turn-helix domain-containing protein n=1 Tax=Flavihumibacter cheonanensis TaxID=1442385 RepID=UPI001EF8132C|nr:helix-turn-helix domain-containing protein [Flavihumibacter cheonanensis]MCG7752781.1 helix-turn-helix domain-containing protein [Flavihumibacter cheonanensis]
MFNFSNYSSLLLLFFVHFIVFSVLLLFRSKASGQASSFWLGVFLFFSALYIAPWMLGFAGWYSRQPYRDFLLYFPTQHLFLLGPVLMFYVKSLLDPGFRLRKKDRWHFLPGLLWCLISLGIFIVDKVITRDYTILQEELDPDFLAVYQIPGYLSLLYYFILSYAYHRRYQQILFLVISNAADYRFPWIRNFLVAFTVILISWLVLAGFGLFYETRFTNSWWYFMAFSLSVYYISIAGLINSYQPSPMFRFWRKAADYYVQFLPDRSRLIDPGAFQAELPTSETDPLSEKGSSQLPEQYIQWKIQLEKLLIEKEWWLDPTLSLPQLAAALQTNTPALSRFINQVYGRNFNDLINQYRVQAFIEKLKAGEHNQQTLLALAIDCGFNSKNTFNRAFKKETGKTPSQFLRKLSQKE